MNYGLGLRKNNGSTSASQELPKRVYITYSAGQPKRFKIEPYVPESLIIYVNGKLQDIEEYNELPQTSEFELLTPLNNNQRITVYYLPKNIEK